MSAPREIEIKLDVDLAGRGGRHRRALLAAMPGPGVARRLVSRYFDTPDHALHARGLVLRVRRVGRSRIQTLKAEGGLVDRPEWESRISGDVPSLDAIVDEGRRAEIASLGALGPVFETRIERTTWRMKRGASEIEVALDIGEAVAGAGRIPIEEVELELVSGEVAALFELAREINASCPVRVGVLSKSERGYALRGTPPQGPVKAGAIELDPDGDAGDAFRAVARSCLRHYRLNEPALLHDRDEEALHQARVALRRLRSAFSLFAKVVAGEDAERLKRSLRSVSRLLGEARNLDVYLARTLGPEGTAAPVEPGLTELCARIRVDRDLAYARLGRRLAGRLFRDLLIDLVEFIEAGAWLSDPDRPARDMPVRDFAAATLRKRRRRVRQGGRHLSVLGPAARHQVRIEAKKLRYASEFFESLFSRGKAHRRRKAFVGTLSRLQDRLGELNDVATGHEMAAAIAERAGEEEAGAPALLFALGHVSGRQDEREVALLEAAEEVFQDFRDAKPFWR